MTILAVTGLLREARIAALPGVTAVPGGADPSQLRKKLAGAISKGARGIISIGVGGGLDPSLKPGDCIVGSEVAHGAARFAADGPWTERMLARLAFARRAAIAGVDAIAAGEDSKAELFRDTGAAVVDTESHIAAQLAHAHAIPFAVLRVVLDAAQSDLPHAALVALGPDGTVRLGAVLGSVLTRPSQVPALLRTARDSRIAFAALLRCCGALGSGLAGPDFA